MSDEANKREIIFDMPEKFGNYRMVCRIGYNYIINYAWWGHLQKQITYKPWPWSKPKQKWVEIDRCWWSTEVTSIDNLKKKAEDFYDEIVELTHRVFKKQIGIK